jgi:poly-gamma-glutamate synthesis protein (capsule biosynthesis protein)
MTVGDIMMARTVAERILEEGPGIVFAQMQAILSWSDLLAGNIECAITDAGEPEAKNYTFAAPPESAEALALAGFDIAVLGNNHSLDYGQAGLVETIRLLQERGISPLGVGTGRSAAGPLFIEKNGLRLAFLSYVDVPLEISQFDTRVWIATDLQPGIAWAEEDRIREDVLAAREEADVVVVFMHNGYEGQPIPVGLQRNVAVAAIDAGAAAVIGSHPHVLQHVELYHGALIAYSLGNFVFDDYGMPENRSAVLRLVLDQSGMISYDFFPVVIKDGLPQPASPEESEEILRTLAP